MEVEGNWGKWIGNWKGKEEGERSKIGKQGTGEKQKKTRVWVKMDFGSWNNSGWK